MNLEQANHCVQLAYFLEKLPKTKWDYTLVRQNKYGEGKTKFTDEGVCVKATCSTTACALGWCPEVFPSKFRIDTEKIDIDNIIYGGEVELIIQCKSGNRWNEAKNKNLMLWFGLPENVVDKLFWGEDVYSFYSRDCMEDVTSKDVARKLYSLVVDAGYDVV